MQVNPEDSPPEIYVTWSDPRMTDFENLNPGVGWGKVQNELPVIYPDQAKLARSG